MSWNWIVHETITFPIFLYSSDGGRYAKGIIVKRYRAGQVIDVDINLSTAHWGYFEFRIGRFDNRKVAGDRYGKLQGQLLPLVSLKAYLNLSKKHLKVKLYEKCLVET